MGRKGGLCINRSSCCLDVYVGVLILLVTGSCGKRLAIAQRSH